MGKRADKTAPNVAPAPQGAVPRQWPAHQIETWAIGKCVPYGRNARVHSPEQVEQIRASLREFGWTMPILAREDGTLIAGHGRLMAAKAEGMTEVPVIVARGWSEDQCRSYALADNKIALNSDWDLETLALELGELKLAGGDLASLGFSEEELSKFLPGDAEVDEDDASPQLGGLSYSIVVRCSDEAHQGELLEKLEKEGLKCEALIS